MIPVFLAFWRSLSGTVKTAILLIAVILIFGLYILWLRYDREIIIRQRAAAESNANLNQQKAEAAKILLDTQTQAQEISNEKQLANKQAGNSDIANRTFANSNARDSSQSSTNAGDARTKYCLVWPEDSRCQERP